MVRKRMDHRRPVNAMNRVVDLKVYDAVILDFDGPMCNLFAGYPASSIADELKQHLLADGWPAAALPATNDPHQILRLVHRQAPTQTRSIEAALTAAEVAAVDTATETPGLAALLAQLHLCRTPVAIASNNSARAIRLWLSRQGHEVDRVVGREPADPSRMKPAPHVLLEASTLLNAERRRAVFVGDALTDAEAAANAGCAFIAFANKPRKLRHFAEYGCSIIVTDLSQLKCCAKAS